MCAVNFNTICGYHIDRDDDQYEFCWLIPLGEWEGNDLIFPQLNIRIKLKPGNILAFRSNLLVHGNLPCSGIRHFLVFSPIIIYFQKLLYMWKIIIIKKKENLI